MILAPQCWNRYWLIFFQSYIDILLPMCSSFCPIFSENYVYIYVVLYQEGWCSGSILRLVIMEVLSLSLSLDYGSPDVLVVFSVPPRDAGMVPWVGCDHSQILSNLVFSSQPTTWCYIVLRCWEHHKIKLKKQFCRPY
jgi:hypothetical protein